MSGLDREAVMGLGLNAPPRAPPHCLGKQGPVCGSDSKEDETLSDKDTLIVLAGSYDSVSDAEVD